jgi:hypothetical protein
MKLLEFVNSLDTSRPKSERATMVENIAAGCKVSTGTAYNWINGKVVPPELYKEKIEEITGQKFDW